MSKATKKFTEAMKAAMKQTTTGYDTTAEVKRIEGGTAWVHIPGGVDETPVKLTVDAKAGDTVQVRVSGGSAWIVGNATSPPTDDKVAKKAQEIAEKAGEANKYITKITGREGVTVHDAGDESNYANMNSNGFFIYKSGKQNASFETDKATMGSGKAVLKYSEDGSAFGMNDSHRVVVAKAADESGVRNDATLSSREISTWDDTKPMAFVNTTHRVSGTTKAAQVGMYAWNGDGTISPIYVILQAGNGTDASPLAGDAKKGLYVSTPLFKINGEDWTSVKGDLDDAVADIADLDTEINNLANSLQSGTVTFSQTSTGSYSDKSITFSPSYSAAPTVVAGFQFSTGTTAANIGSCTVAVVSVSTTGATLRFYNNSGANKTPSVNWIALGA